jgi:predicted protein tyrosine phosphatase
LANLLFICSKNQWRSPTAELLFKNHPLHHARSAGSSKARIKITQKLIDWAEVIFVMERKHKEIITGSFRDALNGKEIVVLEIEDIYRFNDPELILVLTNALHDYL